MPDAADTNQILNADEVADLLQVDASTVRRWIVSGYLAAERLPGRRPRYRVRRADAEALRQQPVTPSS